MVPSNKLKVFPSVPYERGYLFSKKKTGFSINSWHKIAAAIEESEKYDDGM